MRPTNGTGEHYAYQRAFTKLDLPSLFNEAPPSLRGNWYSRKISLSRNTLVKLIYMHTCVSDPAHLILFSCFYVPLAKQFDNSNCICRSDSHNNHNSLSASLMLLHPADQSTTVNHCSLKNIWECISTTEIDLAQISVYILSCCGLVQLWLECVAHAAWGGTSCVRVQSHCRKVRRPRKL